MRSHPTVASQLVAEVVTQLPVPSRLGMLRFERMNEASWALLFLDPSCERQLGIAASDLCALVESPYASLMEPEARHSLHDQIQQQLSLQSHYLVHYTLHTPLGALNLMEMGEAFKQRGRHLLRGYLLVTATPQSKLPPGTQHNPQEQLLPLIEDPLQQKKRILAQQKLILHLARHIYQGDALQDAARLITQAACETYATGRASIWLINGELLESVTVYQADNQQHHKEEQSLKLNSNYMSIMRAGRSLHIEDALNDPRAIELQHYLKSLNIGAMLDAGIRVDGEVIGILCIEHVGGPRQWKTDEIAFCGELADQYAQVLSNQERRSATQALYLFKRAVEQSASAFILLNRDGLVEYVNPSFTAITLYSAEEVQGRRISELPALENLSDLLFNSQSGLSGHNSWQGEFKSRRKNLEPYWSQLSISKVHADDGVLTHYIGIYEDITESKSALQRIERLAFRDNLTGLGNRYSFIRALEKRFAVPDKTGISLLLVDIDNFKRINDSLGHQTGDKLLSSLAKRLRNTLTPTAIMARFASNEFAILLDHHDLDAGQVIASQVLKTLDKPLFVDNQLISITGSIGLACAPAHGTDPQILTKHAGLALHKAKANGKHQVCVFTEALNAEADHKLFVENNLRRALTQNELEVFYQPKLCLKTGALVGIEALLRWHHPQKGMISPDQFIGVAEETGLIIPIGKWVFRQACRMSVQLAAVGMGAIQVAINVSPKQFTDPDLVGAIRTIIEEEQLPPERVELELTESLLLEATDDTRSQLICLKKLGLSLAMDDFGTGYSSLSYLKKFPIDVIKIDRSFIKDIPQNQDDMEITSAVIAMAHNLKIKVVAEGIETSAQLKFLRRQRCDIGQGFLFDKAIAGRNLIDSLKRYIRN
ncbi:bifunctional diguanylate cyclase/phosphodiesterase [Pseudomonas sp. M30-35]|uniref:putative bifunctional diguanylate cyclase/phosphodiesterase n=1 Tax=Pseudomonas sp. M30-35 TaxID=1981174 RepID=UPI000B3C011A|nr:EAL domain-containing protein [Pseudomonas sp. M30-35]ARU90069.1 diguanylate cyclase [Pseudomonas sp. M30-35]